MAQLFKRGYKNVDVEKERQEKAKANMGKKLWNFFLAGDKDEADIHFLTEEPITFYEHNIKTFVNGKESYEQFVCTTDDNCVDCNNGEKASFKGAYLIVDHRPFSYTDKNGNKQTGKDQVRLYVQGVKVLSQLSRISDRYGLSNRDVTVVRMGKGTSTTYTVEKGDESKYTEKEIKALLPEALKDMYDGTMDSLYTIVEEQLKMRMRDFVEDDEEEEALVGGKLSEEEEVDKPNKLKKGLFKNPQNQTKSSAKGLLKKVSK